MVGVGGAVASWIECIWRPRWYNRGQPQTNSKKSLKIKLVPYHLQVQYLNRTVPYRIFIDPESIQYCNTIPRMHMYSTQFVTP